MKPVNYIPIGLMLLVIFGAACQPRSDSTRVGVNADSGERANRTAEQPTIEAAPISEGDGGYKLVSGDSFKLTVRAPNALEVELFYQPVTAGDRALRLETLTESAEGKIFTVDLKIPEDFNGEIWGRAKYPGGEARETEHLLLAKRVELASETGKAHPSPPLSEGDPDAGTKEKFAMEGDESARSDKLTGGRVQRAKLKPGDGNVRITVNVPAFSMTLWQGNKEVKSNYVGVGQKNFPIPVGMRSAEKIILNPDWIPPNSEWVRKSTDVEPYERIPADDPDNPLGKIKIPLGQAYLLHEAQSASDIGNLVSHGCVRVMRDDLFEVTRMIARARDLPISNDQIAAARTNTERRVIDLGGDIPVDINYDTMVVENGLLTIYPDVYERNANTIENLRSQLKEFGVDVTKLEDSVLKQMLDRVSGDKKFVVAIAEVGKGNALNGKVEPLTPQQAAEGATSNS